MGLAGAAVADGDDVLTPVDVLAARQLHDQVLVHRRHGQEVEGVEALDCGEACSLDPALHPCGDGGLSARVQPVSAGIRYGRCPLRHTERPPCRAPSGRSAASAPSGDAPTAPSTCRSPPASRHERHVVAGGCRCHADLRQVGIQLQVESLRSSLDPAQHQVLDWRRSLRRRA